MTKSTKYEPNLEILTKSKTIPLAGDIFVFKPKGMEYYYGKVINPNITMMSWTGILVYIYNVHSPEINNVPILDKEELLIPPDILEISCWSKGYVRTIEASRISDADILPVHCFWNVVTKSYINEHGVSLPRRSEPCGIYGITPYSGLNRIISKTLNIPLK